MSVPVIRISAGLAVKVDGQARAAGWSFADEVHRILEVGLGLHDGREVIVRAGKVCPIMPCWQRRAEHPDHVRLRPHIERELVALAREHRWPIAAEVNVRLARALKPNGEVVAGGIDPRWPVRLAAEIAAHLAGTKSDG